MVRSERSKMPKRLYPKNGYPSVTGVIGQLASYGLMEWFKRTPYNEIIEASKRGREIGSQMHDTIQLFIETGEAKIDTEYPDEITTALQSFMLFKKEHPEFELQRSEIAMACDKYGVNGTTDCIAKHDGQLWIADWKSAQCKDNDKPGIYDEAKIQVAAYTYMFNDLENQNIKDAIIVAIAKDKVAYNHYIMDEEEIDYYFEGVFLPLVKVWNAKKTIKERNKNGTAKA
jgi:hypothetical protein